jgi:hypothetical protein
MITASQLYSSGSSSSFFAGSLFFPDLMIEDEMAQFYYGSAMAIEVEENRDPSALKVPRAVVGFI